MITRPDRLLTQGNRYFPSSEGVPTVEHLRAMQIMYNITLQRIEELIQKYR